MKRLFVLILTGTLLLYLAGCQSTSQQEHGFTPLPVIPEESQTGCDSTLVRNADGGEDHSHRVASEAQTVDDPITGYCGNTQTTLHIGDKEYTFMYGHSVTLTDILINFNYDPMRVCRCRPEYTVDTEFGKGYGINLTQGYARCEKGQADLTQEQIGTIAGIIEWAETTDCKYPFDN